VAGVTCLAGIHLLRPTVRVGVGRGQGGGEGAWGHRHGDVARSTVAVGER